MSVAVLHPFSENLPTVLLVSEVDDVSRFLQFPLHRSVLCF